MVNRIDENRRRRELAEAVWTVIRREGFDAASVRAVAAQAGLSAGSVRHFFGSQDELHIFAMEELSRDIRARITRTFEAARGVGDPPRGARAREVAAETLAILLPHDDETRLLYAANMQFTIKALVQPALAPVARAILGEIREFAGMIISDLVDLGAARLDLDIDTARNQLCAMLDGYALELLVDPDAFAPGEPERNLRAFIDSLDGAHS